MNSCPDCKADDFDVCDACWEASGLPAQELHVPSVPKRGVPVCRLTRGAVAELRQMGGEQ